MPPVQPELTSQQSTLCLAARAASPRCRSSSGNSLCGQNSAGFRESARPFKGIICDDISEFESVLSRRNVERENRTCGIDRRGEASFAAALCDGDHKNALLRV